jgi:acyl CoA:acetate/3-ketoacid CoA transferase alpha subunit
MSVMDSYRPPTPSTLLDLTYILMAGDTSIVPFNEVVDIGIDSYRAPTPSTLLDSTYILMAGDTSIVPFNEVVDIGIDSYRAPVITEGFIVSPVTYS